jgi:hypothetical protein
MSILALQEEAKEKVDIVARNKTERAARTSWARAVILPSIRGYFNEEKLKNLFGGAEVIHFQSFAEGYKDTEDIILELHGTSYSDGYGPTRLGRVGGTLHIRMPGVHFQFAVGITIPDRNACDCNKDWPFALAFGFMNEYPQAHGRYDKPWYVEIPMEAHGDLSEWLYETIDCYFHMWLDHGPTCRERDFNSEGIVVRNMEDLVAVATYDDKEAVCQ